MPSHSYSKIKAVLLLSLISLSILGVHAYSPAILGQLGFGLDGDSTLDHVRLHILSDSPIYEVLSTATFVNIYIRYPYVGLVPASDISFRAGQIIIDFHNLSSPSMAYLERHNETKSFELAMLEAVLGPDARQSPRYQDLLGSFPEPSIVIDALYYTGEGIVQYYYSIPFHLFPNLTAPDAFEDVRLSEILAGAGVSLGDPHYPLDLDRVGSSIDVFVNNNVTTILDVMEATSTRFVPYEAVRVIGEAYTGDAFIPSVPCISGLDYDPVTGVDGARVFVNWTIYDEVEEVIGPLMEELIYQASNNTGYPDLEQVIGQTIHKYAITWATTHYIPASGYSDEDIPGILKELSLYYLNYAGSDSLDEVGIYSYTLPSMDYYLAVYDINEPSVIHFKWRDTIKWILGDEYYAISLDGLPLFEVTVANNDNYYIGGLTFELVRDTTSFNITTYFDNIEISIGPAYFSLIYSETDIVDLREPDDIVDRISFGTLPGQIVKKGFYVKSSYAFPVRDRPILLFYVDLVQDSCDGEYYYIIKPLVLIAPEFTISMDGFIIKENYFETNLLYNKLNYQRRLVFNYTHPTDWPSDLPTPNINEDVYLYYSTIGILYGGNNSVYRLETNVPFLHPLLDINFTGYTDALIKSLIYTFNRFSKIIHLNLNDFTVNVYLTAHKLDFVIRFDYYISLNAFNEYGNISCPLAWWKIYTYADLDPLSGKFLQYTNYYQALGMYNVDVPTTVYDEESNSFLPRRVLTPPTTHLFIVVDSQLANPGGCPLSQDGGGDDGSPGSTGDTGSNESGAGGGPGDGSGSIGCYITPNGQEYCVLHAVPRSG